MCGTVGQLGQLKNRVSKVKSKILYLYIYIYKYIDIKSILGHSIA